MWSVEAEEDGGDKVRLGEKQMQNLQGRKEFGVFKEYEDGWEQKYCRAES